MVKMTSPSTHGKNITYNKTVFEASTYNWVDYKNRISSCSEMMFSQVSTNIIFDESV